MSPKRRLCVVIPTWWNLLCWRRLIEPQILRTLGGRDEQAMFQQLVRLEFRNSGQAPACLIAVCGMLEVFALTQRSSVVFGLRFRFYGLI